MKPKTYRLKADFWLHYIRRCPGTRFPQRFREGKPYSNPWLVKDHLDISVNMWHAQKSVGVYVKGERSSGVAEVSERLARFSDQFEIVTNHHLPQDAPPTAVYANMYRPPNTYDRKNWDAMVDFMEEYRQKYLRILRS